MTCQIPQYIVNILERVTRFWTDFSLISKQIYPYDYLTGPEVYSNTELPSKEKFYDSLREKHISDDDYAHALEVWAEFGCTTLRDYSRLYSLSDVLLLTDIFENFRSVAISAQGLDPLYVYSASGFSWQCWLFSSKVELDYVKDLKKIVQFCFRDFLDFPLDSFIDS